MKKNDLIKLLQNIKGNPEIVIWNGYVNDYMDISSEITTLTLVKETQEVLNQQLRAQYCRENKTLDVPENVLEQLQIQAALLHKKRQWDIPNPFVKDKEFQLWYGNRKLTKYVLSPKLRGKTSLGVTSKQDLEY